MTARIERILEKLVMQHAPSVIPNGWGALPGDSISKVQHVARELAKYDLMVIAGILPEDIAHLPDIHIPDWVRGYQQMYALLSKSLFPSMATITVILLTIFFVLDTINHRKEAGSPPMPDPNVKFKIEGLHNLIFLVGVIGGVLASGILELGEVTIAGVHRPFQDLGRDALLVTMGILSLRTTSRSIRERNEFTWFPIQEVAYLFAGIFVTVIPVLLILKAGSNGALAFIIEAAQEPFHYFWITGLLSSFLDNAPTYLVFFNTELGAFYPGVEEAMAVARLIEEHEIYLLAVSAGAVYMGANTYIGNAPNFMVRSIAEEGGINMPSFFGYILKYSLVILVPVFGLVTWIFFL